MYISACLENVKKILGIEHAHNAVSENIGGGAEIHYLERGFVYLLNLKLFVEENKSVWSVADDVVRKALRLVFKIGQAHRYLRLAVIYGDSLFAAGVVSAGAAVELIRGLSLAHAVKNLGYLCL